MSQSEVLPTSEWEQAVFASSPAQRAAAAHIAMRLAEVLGSSPPLGLLADMVCTLDDRPRWKALPVDRSHQDWLQAYERCIVRPILCDLTWTRCREELRRWTAEEQVVGWSYLVRRILARQEDVVELLEDRRPSFYRELLREGDRKLSSFLPLLGEGQAAPLTFFRRIDWRPNREDVEVLRSRVPLLPMRQQQLLREQIAWMTRWGESTLTDLAPQRAVAGSVPRAAVGDVAAGGYHSIMVGANSNWLPSQWALADNQRPDLLDAAWASHSLLGYSRRGETAGPALRRIQIRIHPQFAESFQHDHFASASGRSNWVKMTALVAATVQRLAAANRRGDGRQLDVIIPNVGGGEWHDWQTLTELLRHEQRVTVRPRVEDEATETAATQLLIAAESLPLRRSDARWGLLIADDAVFLYRGGNPWRELSWDQVVSTLVETLSRI